MSQEVKKRGRPPKSFSECAKTARYERANKLAESVDFNIELLEMALNAAKRYHKIEEKDNDKQLPELPRHTALSGLAHYVEMGYKRSKYRILLDDQRNLGLKTYPSYDKIFAEKMRIIVKPEKLTDYEIHVKMQDLCNNTAVSLIETLKLHDYGELTLYLTCGFDGSSGHKNFNNRPTEPNNDNSPSNLSIQQSLFVSGMLVVGIQANGKKIWTNPKPQSPRFFRTLRLAYEKESDDTIVAERDRLQEEIDRLMPLDIVYGEKHTRVHFKMDMTLLDLKGVNACVNNRSTQTCVNCSLKQSEYKKNIKPKPTNIKHKKYGNQLLHAHIRAGELCVTLGYKSDFGWTVKAKDKEDFVVKQKIIQQKIFKEFNVKIDQVAQGYGKSNTGGAFKKLFNEPEKFANCLGIDPVFVTRLAKYLSAMSSKKELNFDYLEQYGEDLNDYYYEVFKWAQLRTSVHRVTMHGPQIARTFAYNPIYYSEDSLEAWHKLHRKHGKEYARQNSLKNRLTDMMNISQVLSYPEISLKYAKERAKKSNSVRTLDISEFLLSNDESLEDELIDIESSDEEEDDFD